RDFDLNEAETMLRKHITWAKEMKIDTFLTDYKPPDVVAKYFSYEYLCNDKEGRVVMYIDFGNLDLKGLWLAAKPSDGIKTAMLYGERDIKQLHQNNKKVMLHFILVFCTMNSYPQI
ncbi:SEC14-like protein 2, partial [Nephila pilipes]